MPDRQSRPAGQGRDATMRRHTRSLLALAQRLWASGSGLEPALAAIAETAAHVLDVESVKVWQLSTGEQLRCVHSYQRAANAHSGVGFDEALPLPQRDHDHPAHFLEPRVIRTGEPGEPAMPAGQSPPLVRYLRSHRIESLIDAPIRVDGALYGTVYHEHTGAQRDWRRDEIAFAGKIGDMVAMALEIERRKRAEARIEFLELHDAVTGLANRAFFHGALRHVLRRQHSKPRLIALLFIDVDHFYSVNESLGEQGGDRVLTELGERINQATPDEAIIARVESDCFGVLLPRVESEWQAVAQAGKILAVLALPVRADAIEFNVSASIGIAFHAGTSETTPEHLVRDADLASKQAKQQGRGRFEVFDADQHRGLLDRLRIERGLRRSLVDGSLVVAYQAEVDLASGRVRGAEALLRWRDDDGQLRAAADFIDVAETSGLIVPIGRWVLQQACSDASLWPRTADGDAGSLSVNLSARQFEQPGLVDMVREVLTATGLEPGRLCLEITESTLMTRAQSALDTLHGLKALGVRLAVDDFGTGYSSLAYLKRFPVDLLKIDKTMVEGLPTDPNAAIIIGAVVGPAKAMGLAVVVEGVELETQQAGLLALGCRRAQGWLFARAEPNSVFVARLADAGGLACETPSTIAPKLARP